MLKTNQEYLNAIKRVGEYNLKDTHKWQEAGLRFQETGYYCPHVDETADWHEFWDEEEKRIMEGITIDGFYIPGLYYFYLNYLPIYKKQKNQYELPDLYDMDYHTFLCLEHAIFLKKHFGVIKKRQAGFSLKFCVPLIRELWFSRGSPNYIATYEEAQLTKAWTDILEFYKEHLNENTAWYRDFNPAKILSWRVAKDVVTESGKKLSIGRKNTLKGLILSKSASKGVGGGAKFIFADEAGVNPVLSKFLGYVKNQVRYGDVTTGTIIVSGAVGELKHLEGGLKDIILNPESHNFYWVENIWDKDNEYSGKRCGFFVPESWAFYTEDGQYIDEHGNSRVELAEKRILQRREELREQSIEDYNFEISQSPLTLMECFQYRSEKIFPSDIINHQIASIEITKDHGTFVDLFRTKNGQVRHKLLDKYSARPILEFPVKNKMDKTGVIQVWEFPKEGAPYGLYWAGVDITRDSESVNSPSIHSIHIYKGTHKLSEEYAANKIVATYRARPKEKMDWYEKAVMLLEWYNAEALVENNIRWFIQEVIKDRKQYRISKSPRWLLDITPQANSQLTTPYGVPMTDKLMEVMIDAMVRYVSEVIYVTYNEETGEPTSHYGVERIKDLFLLKEMADYKPKKEQKSGDNYDALISFGLALLHAEKNEMLGVIQQDEEEPENNYDNSIKNTKLLLRNSFAKTSFNNKINKYFIKPRK